MLAEIDMEIVRGLPDVIADDPPSTAVASQRQFVDRMRVPFKGNGRICL